MYRLDPHKTYSPGVLTGNWCEDSAAEEIRMKDYLEKKSKGELKEQEFESWKAMICRPINFSAHQHSGDIQFGSEIVSFKSLERNSLLSGDYFEKVYEDGTKIQVNFGNGSLRQKPSWGSSDFAVTVSKSGDVAHNFRNSFQLTEYRDTSEDDTYPADNFLYYGQKFVISTLESSESSVPKHFLKAVNLTSVNFGAFSGRLDVSLSANPEYSCVWQIVRPSGSNKSWELEQRVQKNDPIIIRHCQSRTDLFVHPNPKKTALGPEFEVACHGNLRNLIDTILSGVVDNKKMSQKKFGNRNLSSADDIFQHNCWDNIELDSSFIENAENIISDQMKNKASVPLEEKSQSWEAFYGNHKQKFFKDRKWLLTEFPEILSIDAGGVIFEPGCGVGNSLYSLNSNSFVSSNLRLFGCDFSSTAIAVFKSDPRYLSNMNVFVHDISCPTSFPLEKESVDACLLIFTLSALEPSTMTTVVDKLFEILKPDGLIFFRDYGRYDLTQLRFKKNRLITDDLYVRGDSTLVYYFTKDKITCLFPSDKFEIIENSEDKRAIVNRSRKVVMQRVWIQAKIKKRSL